MVAKDLRTIYQAATLEQAEAALDRFAEHWDKQYPTISRLWRRHWDHLDPVLRLPKGNQEGHLYHQCHRIHEPGTAQDHQDQRRFPHRRGGEETALSGLCSICPEGGPGPLSTGRPQSTSSSSCTKTECPSHETVSYTKSVTDPAGLI